MGATNCPETPRQKMISMMYLVYTALLALNVSVQILDGYELVQDSLKSSITIASNRNNSLAAQFEALAAQNPAKTKQWKDQSAQVAQQSDALCNQIDEIKKEIITKIGGDDMDLKNMNVSKAGRGDLNISSQVGIVEGKGKKLNAAIGQYSSYIQSVVAKDAKRAENIKQTFNTETVTIDGQKKTWESRVFEDMPAIATLTLLTKVQNDIRNTEAEVAQYLIGQVDAGDFRVNKIQAIAVPTTSYVLRGGKYEAQIILAATDSTKPLQIQVNGRTLGKDGKYTVGCGSVGNQKYAGTIKMTKPDGVVVTYPFKSEYVVGEPSATVSADLMNVFYAGFDNPISVSVPGVSAGDVKISASNANLRKTAKGWIVRPITVGRNCDINVSATIAGKTQTMAKKTFRVKALPPPLAFLKTNKGDFPGGKIRKSTLLEVDYVVAKLNDADLDVKFNVFGFDMKTFDSMGNVIVLSSGSPALTAQMKQKMKGLSPGKTFYISGVKAMGPDHVHHVLPAMEVVIQ